MAARKRGGSSENLPANWEEQLEREAQEAAATESSVASGEFFSMQGGTLKWNDSPLPNNQMVCVVLDHVLENVYYEADYDPDNPAGPVCWAFGRDDKDMAPNPEDVIAVQSESGLCHDCDWNQWGSADRGKGKACRNSRRLALIGAGEVDASGKEVEFIDDPEHYEASTVGYMRLPVTSVKGWAGFVKQVSGALKRPPHGIFTLVKVVPDDKNQFSVQFTALGQVPNELMGAIMKRREGIREMITFPYQKAEPGDDDAPAKKAPRKKAAAKRGTRRRSSKY